jgi:hypothetical protein
MVDIRTCTRDEEDPALCGAISEMPARIGDKWSLLIVSTLGEPATDLGATYVAAYAQRADADIEPFRQGLGAARRWFLGSRRVTVTIMLRNGRR